MLLAATAPCLLAGRFADQVAVGSVLRWGLAVCFLVCSAFIWQRQPLLGWCRLAKTSVELDAEGPQIARVMLLAITAWPVIVLTFVAAVLQIASVQPGGPAVGSFFDRLGPNVSYMVPLMLVILGLVGHACAKLGGLRIFSGAGSRDGRSAGLRPERGDIPIPLALRNPRVRYGHSTGYHCRCGLGHPVAGGEKMG